MNTQQTSAEHRKVLHGLCAVCGHYGDDCTGSPAASVAAAPEQFVHKGGGMYEAADNPNASWFEKAAREAGWTHGGDAGGFCFWFHLETWGSWKAAASWEGTADNDTPLHKTYETARELCEDRLPEGWRLATDWELRHGFWPFRNDDTGGLSETIPDDESVAAAHGETFTQADAQAQRESAFTTLLKETGLSASEAARELEAGRSLKSVAAVSDDDGEDDGCPKSDPECLGGAGDCHDACERLMTEMG